MKNKEAQNTRYKTHNQEINMKQRWGKHDTEEGGATKVCGVQATEGR